ncbi:MAG: ATP phosphoribosyltransferase regulatory subunit [Gammaproteobacteria bacterium]|nr:ATP phosphoribosyltransferase regulatory subunit [Gammaproteobacteria bacterium]
MNTNRWMLPDGIAELLPPEAAAVERMRRQILDLYASWGYELVEPPLVEYLESLLTGMGRELDIQTFKLVDQHNGRSMGVRADITPQVARIDAHRLNRDVPTRLCYIGPVLHARGDEFGGNRNPLQVGAELYGHTGIESDLESIELLLATLSAAGLQEIYLDLGHVGIFHGLAAYAGLTEPETSELFAMLQRKSSTEIDEYVAALSIAPEHRELLSQLIFLHGPRAVLQDAKRRFAGTSGTVLAALDYLSEVGDTVAKRYPQLTVHYDLAEFRAYDYQTGLVFAAYREGFGQEIARGGRYDDLGEVFGVARAATGFSTDLMLLAEVGQRQRPERIYAAHEGGPELDAAVLTLREQGRCVVRELPGQRGGAAEMDCDFLLVRQDGQWQIVPR